MNDYKKTYEIFNKVYRTGESTKIFDWEFIKKDGTKIDVEISVSLIKDFKEKAIGFRGIVRDIGERKRIEAALQESHNELERRVEERTRDLIKTNKRLKQEIHDRKQSEDALQKSEKKYRFLAETMADIVWITDSNFTATYVSPSIERSLGFTPEEVYKQTAEEMMTPKSLRKARKGMLKILKQQADGSLDKKPITIDIEYYTKNKSTVWMENNINFIHDAESKIIGFMGVSRDVTRRKETEDLLRKSEEKYRSIMEAMKDAAYISSPDLRINYMNPRMVSRIGRDATGECCHSAIYGIDTKCSWCVFDQIQQGKHVEYELKDPRGNRYYSISNSPVYSSDGNIFKLTISRDITENKAIEAQLNQSRKMESIGTLAGGIAHDFNNILSPILGHTEMMLADVPEDSPFKESLNEIYTGALRARDLVKQILTFSRQDNNELKLMKIQPIITEALKLIRSSIPTTIDIKQDINSDCGIIKADPTQIHQIVMNLSTNACQAMEDMVGELHVSLKEIGFGKLDLINSDMEPGAYACLTITDTGIGMDKDLTEKIFDPFFTTKAIGKGTGMGLSVVHGIVKSMGGAMRVNSEPGKGTEFKVYFPIEKRSFKEPVIQTTTQLQGGTERILLVDDEAAITTMEKRMLERLGYKVTSCTSSVEALDVFRDSPDKFDLVITDMAMPNMSGDKLSTELTKIRSDIPVLLCTGFSEAMSEEKAAFFGINGFLLKPVVMKDLSQKIRDILDENKN